MVATPVEAELQVPPVTVSVKVVVRPTHIAVVPVTTVGGGDMVT